MSVRRLSDQIQHDIYKNLIYQRSRKNNDQTRAIISTGIDAYLQGLMQQQWIASWSPTIIDDSNNDPDDVLNRIMNITVRFNVDLPADFLKVLVVRGVREQFSFDL